MLGNQYREVMLDFETYGNSSRGAIISIGAVKFNLMDDDTADSIKLPLAKRTFYRVVDLQSSLDLGLEQDQSTIAWWAKQSEEAREILKSSEKVPIFNALVDFKEWVGPGLRLWGNGASFDNAILATAYRFAGIESPFKFWDDCCYRTLKHFYQDQFGRFNTPRSGTYHNALDDAITQTLSAQVMHRKLFTR